MGGLLAQALLPKLPVSVMREHGPFNALFFPLLSHKWQPLGVYTGACKACRMGQNQPAWLAEGLPFQQP